MILIVSEKFREKLGKCRDAAGRQGKHTRSKPEGHAKPTDKEHKTWATKFAQLRDGVDPAVCVCACRWYTTIISATDEDTKNLLTSSR